MNRKGDDEDDDEDDDELMIMIKIQMIMYLSPTLLLFPVLGPIQVQTKAQLRENERRPSSIPAAGPLVS